MLIVRHRAAVAVAVLLGAGGGLLVQATRVSASSGPSLTAQPSPVIFHREGLHGVSQGYSLITNYGTAGANVLDYRISGGTPRDFHVFNFVVGGVAPDCAFGLTYLEPASSSTGFASCYVYINFKPVTLWSRPVSTLILTPIDFKIPLIGRIPWALKLTSSPQNSTGTPVIATATADDGSPGHLLVNLFVNGTLKATCNRICDVSLPATSSAGNTYQVAADVGPAGAKPGSKGTAVTRRKAVEVHFTPPHCPSGNCT